MLEQNKHYQKMLKTFESELYPPFKQYDHRTKQAHLKIVTSYFIVLELIKIGLYNPKNGVISIGKIRSIYDGDYATVKRFFDNPKNLELLPLEIEKINFESEV